MEDENQRPEGEPEEPQLHWNKDLSEREKRLYEMWLKASAEEREIMLPLFELAGVQPPFTLPEPPEVVTPEMAALAKICACPWAWKRSTEASPIACWARQR